MRKLVALLALALIVLPPIMDQFQNLQPIARADGGAGAVQDQDDADFYQQEVYDLQTETTTLKDEYREELDGYINRRDDINIALDTISAEVNLLPEETEAEQLFKTLMEVKVTQLAASRDLLNGGIALAELGWNGDAEILGIKRRYQAGDELVQEADILYQETLELPEAEQDWTAVCDAYTAGGSCFNGTKITIAAGRELAVPGIKQTAGEAEDQVRVLLEALDMVGGDDNPDPPAP